MSEELDRLFDDLERAATIDNDERRAQADEKLIKIMFAGLEERVTRLSHELSVADYPGKRELLAQLRDAEQAKLSAFSEVERLQGLYDDAKEALAEEYAVQESLRAAVERLRADGENAHLMWLHWCEKWELEHAEVDGLRAELDLAETKVAEYEAGRPPNDQYLAALDRANAAEAELNKANRDHNEVVVEWKKTREKRGLDALEMKRLRAEIERVRDAARRDIEKLQSELQDAETLIEDLRDGVKLIAKYRTENERLRAAWKTVSKRLAQEKSEVKRLRTEVERSRADDAEWKATNERLNNEVARLQALYDEMNNAWAKDVDRLRADLTTAVENGYAWRAENEKLRGQVLNTRMAKEQMAELEDENEKLRSGPRQHFIGDGCES
jgi:hypothetical protein